MHQYVFNVFIPYLLRCMSIDMKAEFIFWHDFGILWKNVQNYLKKVSKTFFVQVLKKTFRAKFLVVLELVNLFWLSGKPLAEISRKQILCRKQVYSLQSCCKKTPPNVFSLEFWEICQNHYLVDYMRLILDILPKLLVAGKLLLILTLETLSWHLSLLSSWFVLTRIKDNTK